MADKDLIIKEKVEGTGIFDFAGLYKFAYSWLREQEGYGVVEEKYAEKVSGNARDLDIEWRSNKGFSDYFRIEIFMRWEVRGMTEVEVEVNGVKKKMNKGRVFCEFKGTLIRDPESKWETSPWYMFLRNTYNKYVIPSKIDDMRVKTVNEVRTLKDEMKAFLDLTGKR